MKCDKNGLLLYAVTARSWLNGETLYSQVEKALQGGATFIQLREKNLDQDHFMEEALELKNLCAAYHVPIVNNENEEIAAKKAALFETIAVGSKIAGTVSRLTDFGAFVDLGGVDGLIHISEMSWG